MISVVIFWLFPPSYFVRWRCGDFHQACVLLRTCGMGDIFDETVVSAPYAFASGMGSILFIFQGALIRVSLVGCRRCILHVDIGGLGMVNTQLKPFFLFFFCFNVTT